MINVLVVDDSLLIRNILTEILETDPCIKVVGTASNGYEALKKTGELKPDLVTMDIEMPEMDGVEATRRIMEEHPVPVLIITSSEIKRKREVPFYAIKAGAVDIWEKPAVSTKKNYIQSKDQLIREVKIVSSIKVIKRKDGKKGETVRKRADVGRGNQSEKRRKFELIVMGASIGGPGVLLSIFEKLPSYFPVPVLVVQHVRKEFAEGLVRWVSQSTVLRVKTGKDGDTVEAGYVYFAPGGFHMVINSQKEIVLSNSKPVNSCKPSIDVLFTSAAEHYGKKVLGVLLTGMGVDGAAGLLCIKQNGGKTIAQNEASSLVFGMPAKAIEYGAADEIFALEDIISTIKNVGVL